MKINTITCHDVYNHGASLQAYALMKYLQNKGYDVQILDYKPDYLTCPYKLTSIANPKFEKNIWLKAFYILAKFPMRLAERPRKWAFDNFTKKHLVLSRHYTNYNQLKSNSPRSDVYICGSDQIWNTLHVKGKDPAFYLDFGSKDVKRIAYAASFATDRIYDGYEKFVQEKVERIDYVGCRESSGVRILNNLGVNKATHVMDPAFLLNSDEWNEIATAKFDEDYLLVYDFDGSDKIKQKALKISKVNNWKIYTVNPGKFSYADKRFDNVGPDVFLALIRDAKLVISNSFHATVFPLIFKVPFIIEQRQEAINARMEDIFKTINEEDKYLFGEIVQYTSEINELLSTYIKDSKEFLVNALKSVNNGASHE